MSFTQPEKRSKSLKKKSKSVVFIPKSYQKESIKFGLSRPAAGYFLSPGLGKTVIILFIFKILKNLGLVDELLVVANKRIVYNVWPAEIKKWGLPFTYKIIHGKHKRQLINEPSDVKLTNYESLEWLSEQKQYFRRNKKIMLACDESSKLRHTKTIRYKSLKGMLHKFARRYILTGSPAPNGLMGLFGQAYVLDLGKALGEFITHYRNEYFYPSGVMGFDWKLQDGGEKRIFKRLRPLIIRYSHDQLDLPPLTYINRYVTLPKLARKRYDEMEKEFIMQLKNDEIVAANAAVASGKLRQIANGGVFYNERQEKGYKHIHDRKCEDLVELLQELNGEPALIAYEFKHDIERFNKYCAANAKEFKNVPVIGGKSKEKEVDRLLKKWDRGELPALFGHPQSIAHGLNLQGKGGIVIFFSLTFNLENYEQFIQRVWRQGQKRRVLVYRIVARDTVDEIMLHALRMKDKTQQSLLKAMEKHYGFR